VKTVRVEFCQFDQVSGKVAIAEGDLSLDFWRKAHIKFFTPYFNKWNITDINREKVVTEFYELVYRS